MSKASKVLGKISAIGEAIEKVEIKKDQGKYVIRKGMSVYDPDKSEWVDIRNNSDLGKKYGFNSEDEAETIITSELNESMKPGLYLVNKKTKSVITGPWDSIRSAKEEKADYDDAHNIIIAQKTPEGDWYKVDIFGDQLGKVDFSVREDKN